MKTYRKPDGTFTKSFDVYARSWRAIGFPIARVTNSFVLGYDPGISFYPKDGGPAWSLPSHAAIALCAALKAKR